MWEDRANILKALAHPTRLFVVDKLKEKPRSVGWLAEEVECDISTMSRHLSVLKNQDIVRDEKEGTTVNYHLNMPCV
ncbi:MAG: ArsR/SmtB family transcription factor, partial [bacterium]